MNELLASHPNYAKPKGVPIQGRMWVGQGKENVLFHATAIVPYGNSDLGIDVNLSAEGRHVMLNLDRESAIRLARRILDELKVE